ncbi:MAG TPA: glycosyltransferase family 1 protein, partial [Janthinobacterium sp.]|nr:glycosyltransferase family 1 protein [Janthinobacterium sp.]
VCKLADAFQIGELGAALDTLRGDPARRAALGEQARHLLRTRHSPQACADDYAAALALAREEAAGGRHALIGALAGLSGLDGDEGTLRQLANAIARSADPLAQRQLLVDVTSIARHDLKTGIERVVRMQLLELLKLREPGLRVQPVYLSADGGQWHYRYAQRYTAGLLGLEREGIVDMAADVNQGDIFYGADFCPGPVLEAARAGLYAGWRRRGVGINFMLYDLLPVLRPEFFPAKADRTHADWLECIAAQADRLVCISDAVAREMMDWLATRGTPPRRQLQLTALHLGADIDEAAPAGLQPALAYPLLAQLAQEPSFLMVGTIEPRKGHLQALDAFEQLWREGSQARLVIVGNEGWLPLAEAERRSIPRIAERLTGHAELGRRLFWLKGIDDAYLQQIYLHSACLLVPSEGEGFGLPLIEAARYRLPVLARDLPVFREVAQQHAAYFAGLDGASLAAVLQKWLAAHAEGATPASAGMPWMTWQQNAAALLEIFAGIRPGHRWPAQLG